MTKKKIKYGKTQLPHDEFKNVRVRVSFMVDEQTLIAFKNAAARCDINYLKLMALVLALSAGRLND